MVKIVVVSKTGELSEVSADTLKKLHINAGYKTKRSSVIVGVGHGKIVILHYMLKILVERVMKINMKFLHH